MQLENKTIRKMSVEKLAELPAQDMRKISEVYSFAFDSKSEAIDLMNSFIKLEYSKIVNNEKEGNIDFHSTLENVMNNYVRSIFETESEPLYIRLFNNYMKENVGEITEYKQVHDETRKIINFFKTINYQPSEIMCSTILENNSKFSTMIGKIVNRYSKKLSSMNAEEIFPDPTMLSFVTTYAFFNGIELKTNEEENEEIDLETLSPIDTYSDDDVKLYLNSLSKPLLPSKQMELFLKLKEGDEDARNKLIETNLGLVIPVALRHMNKEVNFLDLIQEGNIGLMIAVDKFDCERGCAFSTYANWWIRNYVTRGVMKYGKSIKIPMNVQIKTRKYNSTFNKLAARLKRYPTLDEMVKEMNLTDEQLYQFMIGNTRIVSLDEPIGTDDNLLISDFVTTDDLSVEEDYEKKALENEIRNVLNSDLLDERSIEILKLRNGFYNNKVYTLSEISNVFGISRERINKLEKKAYRKLKSSSYCDDILAYLENGNKIKERVIKEHQDEIAKRRANRFKVNQEEKPDPRKIYAYFTGYKKEELAEVISSLKVEEIEIVKELFGGDLEKLSYRKTSTESSMRKFSNEIIPIIEDRLNTDYIKVLNYFIKCNGLSFDYGKTENYDLDGDQFDVLDKSKINYNRIRTVLSALPQTTVIESSNTDSEKIINNKVLQNKSSRKNEQPKILIYK